MNLDVYIKVLHESELEEPPASLESFVFKVFDKKPVCHAMSNVVYIRDNLSIKTPDERERIGGKLGYFSFNDNQLGFITEPDGIESDHAILVAPTGTRFRYPELAGIVGKLQKKYTVIGPISNGDRISDKNNQTIAMRTKRPGPLVYGTSIDVF